MVDVFEEVEDQLRTERYRSLAIKALPVALGVGAVVLLGALGLWGWDSWQTGARAKASESYSKAMEASAQGDQVKAVSLYSEIARTGPAAYKTMALMQQGGMRLDAGQTEEAVKFFDDAAKASPDPLLGDFARLKSAFALMDTAPYKDVEARLIPLNTDKGPYRMEAKEALAFLKLREGKFKEARTDFVVLSQIFDASQGMRQRAKAAISLIDSGSAGVMAEAVKRANSAKPSQLPESVILQPNGSISPSPSAEAPQ
ncbi:MAG: hypothetical protein EBS42_00620 [Caulobacteraceae bacterium]|nr:hypothetical protein [Caulobacteraceae bacterium]